MSENKLLTGYPSIDKPWLKYYKPNAERNQIPNESIFMRLERCNRRRLDYPAMEMRTSANGFKRGPIISYRKYFNNIWKCAYALKSIGVKKDDIIPIILPNVPECRTLIYAVNILGAVAYPVSPMASTGILEGIVKDNKVSVVFIFDAFWDKYSSVFSCHKMDYIIHLNGMESFSGLVRLVAGLQSSQNTIPHNNSNLNYQEFISLGKNHNEDLLPFYAPNHTAVIVGTSGTTGTSKGVCLSNECLNALAAAQKEAEIFTTGETTLDALISSIGYGISMEHSYGCLGVKSILIPELITDVFPKLLCLTKPDSFAGGPVHYINLSKSEEYKKGKLPFVKNLISGGASLNKDLEAELNKVNEGYVEKDGDMILVRQGYGATECCGSACYQVHGAYKYGGLGIPFPYVNMGIFKPGTDQELQYGEEGEICICGRTIMTGYLNNEEETENVLKKHSDGKTWLHTADLGYCDRDGQFYITDRIKNIFMRTGFNVHPSKISEFIISLPEVKECVVVGVPHPKEQMVPVAFVVLNDATQDASTAKTVLYEKCMKNLSETDIPLDWYFVDESLPRNMGGKIDSKKLLEEFKVDYRALEEMAKADMSEEK